MITITAKPWEYTCGDGCCYESGVEVWVSDDISVKYYKEDSLETALIKYLDAEVTWVYPEE